jgi:hypothetical protein
MPWTVDRIVSLLAGSFILLSLALGRFHHRRWRLMTVAIGANQILRSVVGWCPSSLALRKLGVAETWAGATPATTAAAPSAGAPIAHEPEVVATAR